MIMKPYIKQSFWMCFWIGIAFFVLSTSIANADEPTEPEKLLILDYYPIEYCIAALNLSTTILDKESPKNFSRYDAQTTALLWYLTTPGLDSDVTDLISMKMIDLLAKGNFSPEDMVAAGAECNITYMLMLQKGI